MDGITSSDADKFTAHMSSVFMQCLTSTDKLTYLKKVGFKFAAYLVVLMNSLSGSSVIIICLQFVEYADASVALDALISVSFTMSVHR
jgi:hypothetical protein